MSAAAPRPRKAGRGPKPSDFGLLLPLSLLEGLMRRPLSRLEWRDIFSGPTQARTQPHELAANDEPGEVE
jgi:hypothetical protein